jgi:hypothetical protein
MKKKNRYQKSFAYSQSLSSAHFKEHSGILKQVKNFKEQIFEFTSAHLNDCQKNYSIIKKEILLIVICITKF